MNMAKYVDGFLLPLSKDKVEEYRRIAEQAGKIWMEHGALAYWECAGDDLDQKDMISFKSAAKALENETVIFSWIVFESREQRDKVNEAVMADSRMTEIMESAPEPFDYKRMAYGGFKAIVEIEEAVLQE
jgi:uncharacterized protein YbaA (DUF1428 family)